MVLLRVNFPKRIAKRYKKILILYLIFFAEVFYWWSNKKIVHLCSGLWNWYKICKRWTNLLGCMYQWNSDSKRKHEGFWKEWNVIFMKPNQVKKISIDVNCVVIVIQWTSFWKTNIEDPLISVMFFWGKNKVEKVDLYD